MNFIYFIQRKNICEALNDVNVFWGGLHQNRNTISEDRYSCKDAQKCEQKCANWVNDVPIRPEIDDNCSNDYSNTLNDISNNMNNGCSDVHVFVAVSMTMRMTMSMRVTMTSLLFLFLSMLMLMIMLVIVFMFMFVVMLVIVIVLVFVSM